MDNATVEKLAVAAFEETLIPVWELTTAFNMATKRISLYQDKNIP